jgi:LmbE family N-acetylglucosaminyl deacetylase
MPATLLSVLAHPDDESFGMGGTLAYYASRGVKVYLVCATLGEAGDVPQELLQEGGSAAAIRRGELECAAEKLGLSGVFFLGYRDSGMLGSADNVHPHALAAQTTGTVAKKVADYIRQLHPQAVLTFDPIGGYNHPDHVAIHRATVAAFDLAANPEYVTKEAPYRSQKLYFHVMPKGWMRWTLRLLPLLGRDPRRYGRNKDIDLVALVEEGNFPIHAKINYEKVAAQKDAAAACHQSQLSGGPPRRGIVAFLMRRTSRTDHFMRAVPPPVDKGIERDLFQDVDVNI